MKTTNLLLSAVLVFSLAFGGLSTASDTYASNNKSSDHSRKDAEKRNEASYKDKDDDRKDKRDDKKNDHRKDDDRKERKDDKKSNDHDDKRDERSKDDDKRDHKDDDHEDRKDHNKPDRSERDDKSDKDKKSHKFTICHATNSTKNPYVMIRVDYHSLVKKGHDGHEGDVATSMSDLKVMKENKERWGDVIPAVPEHNYPGKNWNADGKALLDNNCKFVTVAGDDDSRDDDDGNGAVTTPDDEAPVVNVLDEAASTDVPALAGKGGVASELPSTGQVSNALIVLAAGVLTAVATYGGLYVRKSLF